MPTLGLAHILYLGFAVVFVAIAGLVYAIRIISKIKKETIVHLDYVGEILGNIEKKFPYQKDLDSIESLSRGYDSSGDLRQDLGNGKIEPNFKSYKLVALLLSDEGWGSSQETAARIGRAYRLRDKADELLAAFNLHMTTLSFNRRLTVQHYYNIMYAALSDGATPSQALRVSRLMQAMEAQDARSPLKKGNGAGGSLHQLAQG